MNRIRYGDFVGPAFAVVGILGFSFKAILIKLAYAWASIDAVTLLTLRMLYSAPFSRRWRGGRREIEKRLR